MTRELLAHLLHLAGYEPLVCGTGERAFLLLRAWRSRIAGFAPMLLCPGSLMDGSSETSSNPGSLRARRSTLHPGAPIWPIPDPTGCTSVTRSRPLTFC